MYLATCWIGPPSGEISRSMRRQPLPLWAGSPLASALASKIVPAPRREHDFHFQHSFFDTFGFGALDGYLGFLLGALGGSIGLTSGALGGSSVCLGALLASFWMLLRLS